jgi:biopolymer transport protein ExbB/biopolymer transport protein TolQ
MNPLQMFIDASWVGKAVIVILTGLSVYSIAVMIDKFRSYKAARDESLQFLPHFVKNLKDSNFQGALDAARKYKKSHIARVVSAGLIEYDNDKAELKDSHDLVGAVGRALDRVEVGRVTPGRKGREFCVGQAHPPGGREVVVLLIRYVQRCGN